MNSIAKVRRNLLLINAVVTGLLLWLTLSFWYDAYVQRKDAIQLQQNIQAGDSLFRLANDLSEERGLYNASLNASRAVLPTLLKKLDALQQRSDEQLTLILEQIRRDHLNASIVGRYRDTSFILPDWLDQLDLVRRRLEVSRGIAKSQMFAPVQERDSSMSRTLFENFSLLIGLVEKLKAGTQFIPRHNEMHTLNMQDLKLLVWEHTESAKQEISLLTGFMSSPYPLNEASFYYQRSLQEKGGLVWNKIVQQNGHSGINPDIAQAIDQVQQSYDSEYENARSLVLLSARNSDDSVISQYNWSRIGRDLLNSIDQLGVTVTNSMRQIAQDARKQGERRLWIDTAIVALSLAISFLSIGLTKKVRHIAYHDNLTSLPNRSFFESILSMSTDGAGGYEQRSAVLIFDLNRFKTINDTFGHSVGDEILKELADRLRTLCMTGTMVARVGGDEFAVLLKDVESDYQPVEMARKLITSLEQDVQVNGANIKVGVSVGVSISPEDGETAQELLKNADIAMYQAKIEGNECVYRFNKTMADRYRHQVQIETDLKKAVGEQQFELYYQPQVNVATGRVDSLEALLRWNHPDRGFVSPAEFIPIAEDAGLLSELGAWVLDDACRQLSVWRDKGIDRIRIAVNISAQQFAQGDFYDKVIATLERHSVDHHCLELEVTESIVMNDVDRVANILKRLRKANIKIAVDDFGTGYSSLQYLQDLPLDTLKIDKAFVTNLGVGDPEKSVANSIIQLSRSFDLDTVAEGVETLEQCKQVEVLGVKYIQGYFYSKPVPAADVPDVIFGIEDRTGGGLVAA